MSSKLNLFLSKYRLDKNNKDGTIITHTGQYRNKGTFHIPEDKYDELYDIMAECAFKEPMDLVERSEVNTNIKIDLDFKYNVDPVTINKNSDIERQLDEDFIKQFVINYNECIEKYLDVPEQNMESYVMMRDYPYKNEKNVVKDGIHIMYPYIICDYNIQELIRKEALHKTSDLIKNKINEGRIIPEDVSEVIDVRVIQTNGWMVYGCSKVNTSPYKIKYVFSRDMEQLDNDFSTRELMKLLSVRNHKKDEIIDIRNEQLSDLSEHKMSKIKVCRAKVKSHNTLRLKMERNDKPMVGNSIDQNEINLINELVNLLSEERAKNYSTWLQTGFCLYNISPMLYDTWVEFSRKASNFDEEECANKWQTMKTGTLGLGSLHLWAKEDNPVQYSEIMNNSIRIYIERSTSKTTSDISRVIYEMYKYKFKYAPSSSKNGTWYEFYNHRWHISKEAHSLMTYIDTHVLKAYLNVINSYSNNINENISNMDLVANSMAKMKPLQEITYLLRDITNKNKYLSELKILFSDQEFESKLDTNIYYLGFENGVYDLQLKTFRQGVPEDYITMTTGIDYIVFDDNHEYIVQIFDFMSQLFVDEDKRMYMMYVLASSLEGINANEKFYIMTGVGGNGKSKLIQLMENAFGDYIKRVPTTLFTQKNKSSGSATPETSRLHGVRLITAQETNKEDKFNISLVKEMSGNDKLYVRGLHKDGCEIQPQFKIFFFCNHKPSGLEPDDEAIWRRMSIIDFDSRFVEHPDPKNKYEFPRDNYLSEKLNLWKEAFAYLLTKFYDDFKKYGLIEPQCVIDANKEYRKSSDSLAEFIIERTVEDKYESCKLDDIYKEFVKFWAESGNKPSECPKKTDFKSCLEKKWGAYNAGVGWKGYKIRVVDEFNIIPIDSGSINK